jgi:hypothetical protein
MYLNLTSLLGREGLVREMLTLPPSQIVSDLGVKVTLTVGSTQIKAVSLIPVHFSPFPEEFLV